MIAVIALWIAYQQHKTNVLKLKLDLVDKRLVIFASLRGFLGEILREVKISYEACFKLLRDTNQAESLFGKDNAYHLCHEWTDGQECNCRTVLYRTYALSFPMAQVGAAMSATRGLNSI